MILTFRQVQILICTLQTTLQVPLKPSQKTLLRDNSLNSNPKNSLSTKIQQINNEIYDDEPPPVFENDLDKKPLTRAVFHESLKNSKKNQNLEPETAQ